MRRPWGCWDAALHPWSGPYRATPRPPFADTVAWAQAQAGTHAEAPRAGEPIEVPAIPSDEALLELLQASAYTSEGHHRRTLTNAQRTGAAPSRIPSLLWICSQRLRPEHAVALGFIHYPEALSADPEARDEGPLVPGGRRTDVPGC